ncbi:MAG: glycine betaine ABC transporter substrate-binding protein, partial [Rhodovibrionaceae bacterium]|nr:glycine betaine ABC transporter substrate-binding protein [Rhodovibrionaceae bacterium]
MRAFSTVKKLFAGVATVALLATPLATANAEEMPGKGTTVKMARATWDTGWFQTEVYKQLLEELGYEIPRVTTLDNPPFYQSVGQGDMDLWVNGWFPVHNTYRPAFEPRATTV